MRQDHIKKHQEGKKCIESAVFTLQLSKNDLHLALRVLRRAGFARMGSLMVSKRKVSIPLISFIDGLEKEAYEKKIREITECGRKWGAGRK